MSTLEDLGTFLQQNVKQNECTLISSDRHADSLKLIKDICVELAQSNIDEQVMERCATTALLSYLVMNLDSVDVGIMVTCTDVANETCDIKVISKQGILLRTFEINVSEVNDDFSRGKLLPKSEISKWMNVYLAHVGVQAPLDPMIRINRALPIVMTTMHGASGELLQPVLRKLSFKKVMFVPEEENADGRFGSSDPRNTTALSDGMRYLRGSRAGMMLAIDPAGERMTVTLRESSGEYRLLSSAEVSLLLADYQCFCRSENGILPKSSVLITPQDDGAEKLARKYGIKHQVVDGGFTSIGTQLLKNQRGFFKHPLLMATDGRDDYLIGQYVNYPDALSAAVVMCELYCYYESTPGVGMMEHLHKLMS
jgi:phosphoglucomutase